MSIVGVQDGAMDGAGPYRSPILGRTRAKSGKLSTIRERGEPSENGYA